jgi:hypothetical protein
LEDEIITIDLENGTSIEFMYIECMPDMITSGEGVCDEFAQKNKQPLPLDDFKEIPLFW